MSTWRRKAIECFPDKKAEYEQKETSIYSVFFDLLPATRQAHIDNNEVLLEKYYNFAAWCFHQKRQGQLSNAAAVAFYEHLGDDEATLAEMDLWVTEDIFIMVRPLLYHRLPDDKLERIDALYRNHRSNRKHHKRLRG